MVHSAIYKTLINLITDPFQKEYTQLKYKKKDLFFFMFH